MNCSMLLAYRTRATMRRRMRLGKEKQEENEYLPQGARHFLFAPDGMLHHNGLLVNFTVPFERLSL